MHKQLLFELEEKDGYYVRDGKNLGNKIKLYCYKSDENNIYLDTPVIDYPDLYTVVKNGGTEIPLRKQFEDQGYYKHFYAIISKHKKITSIENFFIEECNSFYSIEITKEAKDIIESIGFDNLIVNEKLFDNYLINFTRKNNGYELLFFIHSSEEFYEDLLINYKLKIVRQKINMFCERFSQNGLHLMEITEKGISIVDIKNTIQNKVKLYLDDDSAKIQKLAQNEQFLKVYGDILYERIEVLFRFYKDYPNNYLYFGYTDEVIIKELKEAYGGLFHEIL